MSNTPSIIRFVDRFSQVDRYIFIAVFLSAILSIAFITHYYLHPSYGDVAGYRFFAFQFRRIGWMHDIGNIRTYLYPTFLYWLSFISGISSLKLGIITGVAQVVMLITSSVILSRQLNHFGMPKLALGVLLGTLLNPIVLAVATDGLTEGFIISLTIASISCAIVACDRQSTAQINLALAGGSFLLAISVLARPASILVFAAWIVAFCFTLAFNRPWKGRRVVIAIGFTIGALLSLGTIGLPQLIYNGSNYGILSFLPACSLGIGQMALGIAALKYDTSISGQSAGPLVYENFFAKGIAPSSVLDFYLGYPIRAAASFFTRIILSFSPTDILVYIRTQSPWYMIPLSMSVFSLSVTGMIASARKMRSVLQASFNGVCTSLIMPPVFIAVFCVLIICQNGVVELEMRFNLLPQTVFIVFGIASLLQATALASVVERLRTGLIGAMLTTPLVLYVQASATDRFTLPIPPVTFDWAFCVFTKDGSAPNPITTPP